MVNARVLPNELKLPTFITAKTSCISRPRMVMQFVEMTAATLKFDVVYVMFAL